MTTVMIQTTASPTTTGGRSSTTAFLRVHFSAAVTSYRIWRGQDDPGLVILEETYESREAAEGALNNPDLLPELVTAGVEMSSVRIDYVDELESGSH